MIYVDQLVFRENVGNDVHCIGDEWCHLWADSLEEVHVFAEKLFLPKLSDAIVDMFHDHPALPHYDLSPFLRERALALGAVEYDLTAFFR